MDYGMGFYGGYGLNGMPQAAYGVEEDVLQQHAKRQRTDAGSAGAGYEKEGQDPERTVFVGGIGPDANEDELKTLFSQYGGITSVKIIYDRTVQPPRCKGFGFVTFDDTATADQLRTVGKLDYKGRSVDIGKAGGKSVPHQGIVVPVGVPSAGAERKVFVGNIPKEADETTLQWFFQEYGAVEEVKLVTDQGTGNRKGYGFVTFADRHSADNVKKIRQADFMGRTMNFGDAVAGGLKAKQHPSAAAPSQQASLGRGGPAGPPGGGMPMGYGGMGPWAGAPGGGMLPPGFAGMGGPNPMGGQMDPNNGQFVQSAFGAFAFGPALTAHSGAGQYDPFGGMGMGGMGPGGMVQRQGGHGLVPNGAQVKASTISFMAASGGLPAKTQLSVPEACVFRLAGQQGANLNAMMMQSGAVLMLHPANPKADRILEITGTTPQVQVAQQMVSAIVLSLSPTAPPERDPACKVFVGGLASTTDVPQIIVSMFRFGPVAHAKIPVDPATGRQRGFGFVVFADANAAHLAKTERSVAIDGRNVEIKDAMKGAGKQQQQAQGQ